MTSVMAWDSALSERRNFSRAGVAKKRSRSSITVPRVRAAGLTGAMRPPATVICAASRPWAREVIVSRPTAPSEGSASPRKPKLRMFSRSDPSIFEVAWRDRASGRSSPAMPQPSSVTRIRVLPPSATSTVMRLAPASSAFSTSSFTADAGRSTTSPAAMRLIAASSSWRICGRGVEPVILGAERFIPPYVAGMAGKGHRFGRPMRPAGRGGVSWCWRRLRVDPR